MGKEVVAFRIGLPTAGTKFGKALVNADMKKGFHIEKRFAKAVHASEGRAADPLVACGYPSTEPRHPSGDFGSGRVASRSAEELAEGGRGCA